MALSVFRLILSQIFKIESAYKHTVSVLIDTLEDCLLLELETLIIPKQQRFVLFIKHNLRSHITLASIPATLMSTTSAPTGYSQDLASKQQLWVNKNSTDVYYLQSYCNTAEFETDMCFADEPLCNKTTYMIRCLL